ncbi:MAG: hypothetical protein QHC78_13085 [Pigmentiphaga sp.]|uniref:hypothetical protein n=1 Tax=Pigmentiphaga sp. TaxID=1977564 RepID=UPI0029ABFE91|nr:hypothetical protein [Pigmentiphaga sp.]MDX3906615.1 hypothetical protein [Pigmentiphaga sp.]
MNEPLFPVSDGGEGRLFDACHVPGTIGADPVLRHRIESALEKLCRAREQCLGYTAYAAVVAGFKRDFAIASYLPWTEIWNWPAERAAEILNYLHGRHAETLGASAPRRSA